jgi:hypothetical protein
MFFLCSVPEALGRVVRLRTVKRRMVADTEAGIVMVVPVVPVRDVEGE